MIELMPESSDNIVGIQFTGKASSRDYRDVLTRHVNSLLERFITLRALILIDEAFTGLGKSPEVEGFRD